MIIVAGHLRVAPCDRADYLDGCVELVRRARHARGCLYFCLAADPLESDRINIFERWNTVADVDAFRGSGTSDEQTARIIAAEVAQYEVTATVAL